MDQRKSLLHQPTAIPSSPTAQSHSLVPAPTSRGYLLLRFRPHQLEEEVRGPPALRILPCTQFISQRPNQLLPPSAQSFGPPIVVLFYLISLNYIFLSPFISQCLIHLHKLSSAWFGLRQFTYNLTKARFKLQAFPPKTFVFTLT